MTSAISIEIIIIKFKFSFIFLYVYLMRRNVNILMTHWCLHVARYVRQCVTMMLCVDGFTIITVIATYNEYCATSFLDKEIYTVTD